MDTSDLKYGHVTPKFWVLVNVAATNFMLLDSLVTFEIVTSLSHARQCGKTKFYHAGLKRSHC